MRPIAQVDDPGRCGPSSPIPLPGSKSVAQRGVCEGAPIRGIRCQIGAGYRELLGVSTIDADGEELGLPIRVKTAGAEQHPLPIRRPPTDIVPARMEGEALWAPSFRRDDENVRVSVVLSGKGDPSPVR